jgi:hypothetical protein
MPNLPLPRRAVRRPSLNALTTRTALVIVAVAATACGTTAPPSASVAAPSTSPSESPRAAASATPAVGAIEHSTAATDVILRIEHGGGFVPIEFLANQAPEFTLYGNGVVVFQQAPTVVPEPDANGVVKGLPWRTASLDEDQVQELLEFALIQGGLGAARETYMSNGIADAPNTVFTIHAGGVDKTVAVNGLGIDTEAGPDVIARAAFARLAARLQDFDRGGSIGSDVYQPERYRGVLIERDAAAAGTLPWPWPLIKPGDFKPGAGNGNGEPVLPHRTMTATDVAALALSGIEGGVQGLTLGGPDGKTYGFILRPLLVDEAH